MRTICLQVSDQVASSLAEVFLRFSPRVQYRSPGWIFIDVSDTWQLFESEDLLLKEIDQLAHSLQLGHYRIALADSPFLAQALASTHTYAKAAIGEHKKSLRPLPLDTLLALEGLSPWANPREVESIVDFFSLVGLRSLGQLLHFEAESFRQRWGETGYRVWQRLHGREIQKVSPLLPEPELRDYIYFDTAIEQIPFLCRALEPLVQRLFKRLEGRGRFLKASSFTFFCEYSQHRHLLTFEVATPHRDPEILLRLLARKLETIDLTNPIREVEIEIKDVPEKVEQMDFFESRDVGKDNWLQLTELLQSEGFRYGFYHFKPDHLPEASIELNPTAKEFEELEPLVEQNEGSVRVRPVYSHYLQKSPRPRLILKDPLLISKEQKKELRILKNVSRESIESDWWSDQRPQFRDYFIASDRSGRKLWVYRDLKQHQDYIHGYFD